MRINKYRPHILVLPEDDANRQIANGFLLNTAVSIRNIQILEEAGGWIEVLERFKSDHIDEMECYPQRLMVLLIDFDDRDNRLECATAGTPRYLANRVFILGASSEPEALKAALGFHTSQEQAKTHARAGLIAAYAAAVRAPDHRHTVRSAPLTTVGTLRLWWTPARRSRA